MGKCTILIMRKCPPEIFTTHFSFIFLASSFSDAVMFSFSLEVGHRGAAVRALTHDRKVVSSKPVSAVAFHIKALEQLIVSSKMDH